jgi:processing peptidase subunit beta
MTARRVALSLQQGLRTRTALNSLTKRRNFATPINYGTTKTETTTLSNGFTVGSEMVYGNIFS